MCRGQVKEDIRSGVLGLIEKEREGEVVDRELLKSVVNVRAFSCALSLCFFGPAF